MAKILIKYRGFLNVSWDNRDNKTDKYYFRVFAARFLYNMGAQLFIILYYELWLVWR